MKKALGMIRNQKEPISEAAYDDILQRSGAIYESADRNDEDWKYNFVSF